MEIKEKMQKLAKLLCEEISMAIREKEGDRYFVTGTKYTDWDSFTKECGTYAGGSAETMFRFAECTSAIPDLDAFLESKEARESAVVTARNALSECLGPRGTFVVARMPRLVRDEHCPEEQVQEAHCAIRGGYPHVRCVVVRDKHAQKQCSATFDMAYYRLS